MEESTRHVTDLLARISDGDADAQEPLFELVYDHLRVVARRQMSSQPGDHTLQPTALVHEAWMKLLGRPPADEWNNRAHFLSVAARAMRQLLVDHARRKRSRKRGDGAGQISLDQVVVEMEGSVKDLTALDEALQRFAAIDARTAKIVELKFFGGLTNTETAAVLEISRATVERGWQVARLWLRREVSSRS